jgi:hypothetical protein
VTSPDDPILLEGGGRNVVHRRGDTVIRDTAPWNIVARDGMPVAFIDWETAGPVDPLVELAQLAWLNAKLHDDIVAGIEHLPPAEDRARQLAAIADAYGLTARQRRGLLDQIIEFAIVDTAWEADDARVGPDTTSHPIALWAMACLPGGAGDGVGHRPGGVGVVYLDEGHAGSGAVSPPPVTAAALAVTAPTASCRPGRCPGPGRGP